jgi:hypothetical protein
MKSDWMKVALLGAVIAGTPFFSVAAQAETLNGKLIELSSVDSSVTVQLKGTSPEMMAATYKVAGDARWHICLKDTCVVRKGVEGFKTVNEYAEFGAYGIPHKTYDVMLNVKDKVATELEVQIVSKLH